MTARAPDDRGVADDPLIGKLRIRAYPVEERNGMIFVFVRDEDHQPAPPLSSDPPLRIGANAYPDAAAYILDGHDCLALAYCFATLLRGCGGQRWRR
jgi:phenylpropionate dioxygenase-like ring-hydroxylating dioxygenase large terminal subunit